MKKRMALLLAAVLTAAGISGCGSGDSAFTTGLFSTTYPNDFSRDKSTYPIANEIGGGTLLRAGNSLYRWDGDEVSLIEEDPPDTLRNLVEVGGKLYYWKQGGIFRYNWKTGESTQVFSFDEPRNITRFWASNGVLYAFAGSSITDDYLLYRYDIRAKKGEKVNWVADIGRYPIIFGVVGDEALVSWVDSDSGQTRRFAWMDTTDGSTRPCTLERYPNGYRDGSLIVYQAGWEEIILHDIETCEETAIPVPRRILAAEDPEVYILMAVGEDSLYWLQMKSVKRKWREVYAAMMENRYLSQYTGEYTFYRQEGDSLEPFFTFRSDVYASDMLGFAQLIGDTFYFAYSGTPQTFSGVRSLIPPDDEPIRGRTMVFAARKPDGEICTLVERPFPVTDTAY